MTKLLIDWKLNHRFKLEIACAVVGDLRSRGTHSESRVWYSTTVEDRPVFQLKVNSPITSLDLLEPLMLRDCTEKQISFMWCLCVSSASKVADF